MQLKIVRYSLFAFLFLAYNSCKKAAVKATVSCTNSTTLAHPKGTALQQLLDEYVKKGLPGISVLLGDGSGVWYGAAGKADLENNIDYSPCTVQKLGSITKMMIGVLTMKLVEEGKVNLDDPISKWIDADVLKNIKNADQVSIRNCLQHTTGIYDIITSSGFYLAVLSNPNKHWTSEELLSFIKNQPANFAANTSVKYSNSNTIFVALCIEKITGRNHSDLLREKVFTPLGMNDTYYHWHDAVPSTTAQGYFDLYNNKTIVNVSNLVTGSGNGFTGVYSNVFDLQKFVNGVFINPIIVSKSTLDSMMQWKFSGDNLFFGMGLFKFVDPLNGVVSVGHTGGDLGYACEVYYYPNAANKNYYVTCVNYGTNGKTFLSPVYDEFVGKLKAIVIQ